LERNEISGFFDLRYKMGITAFGKAQKCRYVGDKSGFSNDSETTISGIVSIIKEALKITNDIVDKLRAYGCFA
jgi:hypothetical protein